MRGTVPDTRRHCAVQLELAAAAGAIRPAPLDALAHVLLAGLVEGSLYLANAADKQAARAEVGTAISAMLDGLASRRGKH